MRVFVSSLISGFEAERAACRRAIRTLRYEPEMAEDFGARPDSPQVSCLKGLRSADVVVLVLGERYGEAQAASGLSATHEEYREARETKPILAFVRSGMNPEPRQAEFIAEVQGWEKGVIRNGFADADELFEGVLRGLHDVTLADTAGPVDQDALERRAREMLPQERSGYVTAPAVQATFATGPRQRILRPAEIEDPQLADRLLQQGMFGDDKLFQRALGTDVGIDQGALNIVQPEGAAFRLDEDGSMNVRVPLAEPGPRRGGFEMGGGMLVVVEEIVTARLGAIVGFAAATLEAIDPTQRVTHVATAVMIAGADHHAWRTAAEHAASPNSMSYGSMFREREPVTSFNRRAALRLDRSRLVEDLVVPLRRLFPRGG